MVLTLASHGNLAFGMFPSLLVDKAVLHAWGLNAAVSV